VNRSFAEAIGKPQAEILGKTDLELGFPEELVFGNPDKGIRGFRTDDREAMAGQIISNSYDPVVVADGSLRVFDTQKMPLYGADGKVFAVLGIARDMTERYEVEDALKHSEAQLREKAQQLEQTLRELQQTQSQLIQNEKMSSLGQLVAGVAHEINNPVNFIYGNLTHADEYARGLLRLLTLYQRHYPHPIPSIQSEADAIDLEFVMVDLPKLMKSMRMGANRIQKIVASLRVFSRMDEAEMKAVDIHEGIDSTLMILQNRLKARSNYPEIQVMKFYSELPLVECFPGQLNQVFMNILSNAIDALEEVMERNSSFSPCIQIWTECASKNQIKIRIIDNGSGIPAAIQQQIFDPFFTTKPVGKGTGLGMSISYQIITERHKGSLTCHSQPEKGTEFAIEIPICQ
jgi:signal transduction histidine kinase